jgi:hypothetical protein
LLTKLFWPTVRKNCSSDREFFLKFEAEGWEFSKFLWPSQNCANLLYLRNLQEQVKKAFCYQKLFWSFTVWIDCSSDREFFLKFKAEGREFTKILRSQ